MSPENTTVRSASTSRTTKASEEAWWGVLKAAISSPAEGRTGRPGSTAVNSTRVLNPGSRRPKRSRSRAAKAQASGEANAFEPLFRRALELVR